MKSKRKSNRENDKQKDNGSRLFFLILIFFFISGFTGLIYQILWTKQIIKIIGAAPFAVSIVLTVFMGGLGLGSYLASRIVDRIAKTEILVLVYGVLETVVGLYGFVFPFLSGLFKPVNTYLYNHLFNHFLIYNLLLFSVCTLFLLIPVTCMGATLPVLSRFYVRRFTHLGTHLGRLYGINTFGAAAGSLACGFWIIQFLGIWGSLITAITLNILIGASCYVFYLLLKASPKQEERNTIETVSREFNTLLENPKFQHLSALTIFAVSGFCAMAYEVIWTKLLGLIVGPTTYSFTIVITTFITGLALGGMFFGWQADKTDRPLTLLVFSQISAALFALCVSQIMGNSQIFFAKLIFKFSGDFSQLILLKSMFLFLLMFFPTFFLGATFPLVGKIYTQSLSHIGKSIGVAYSINTIGAVLGSFCAGFVLIPLVGKEHGLRLVIILQLLTSLAFGGMVYWQKGKSVSEWVPFALLTVLGLILVLPYPNWNRKMLSIGQYHRFEEPKRYTIGWLESLLYGSEIFTEYITGDIVYYGDGIGGFTTVLKDTDILGNPSYSLFNSGKSDASTDGGDMCTQTLLAHFPMMFHPLPKHVMVLGLASGVTAGEVLLYPVDRVDVIDINNQVVAASRFFNPWNYNVLDNPRTNLIIQDGRAHIELTDRTYDVVISEPSNPWMAGLATLFTRDFFTMVRDKLNPGGIFVQWIYSYQINWDNFALICRTFAKVFPKSVMVNTDPSGYGADYLLVGFNGPVTLYEETAKKNFEYARLSKNMTLLNYNILYSLIVHEDVRKLFGEGLLNTDEWPRLELSAPKIMDLDDLTITERIKKGRWLTESMSRIADEVRTTVDGQIDYAAYVLSFKRPYKNMVDLSKATPEQKNRYNNLIETYCSENIVTDFSFISDEELKKKCMSLQIQMFQGKLGSVPDKSKVYYQLGVLSNDNNSLDDALRFYQEALKLDSEMDKALYKIARIENAQGKTEDAVLHYRETIQINPHNILAYNNLANIYARQEKFKEAVELYEKALTIDPFFAIAHRNYGSVLKKIGRTQEGEAHIRESQRLEKKTSQ